MKINHIFFDLDRTLWDFEINSHSTLEELFSVFNLKEKGIPNTDEFISIYKAHNEKLWGLYRVGKISQKDLRRERFQRALSDFGIIDSVLAEQIGEQYISICPKKNQLFPYSIEVLDYLFGKYKLHIITNGFRKVQHVKLKHANLTKYFDSIITSEQIGVMKPNPKIFNHALDLANATTKNSIMIGDNYEADILGALNIGLDAICFNYHKETIAPDIKIINHLLDLKKYL